MAVVLDGSEMRYDAGMQEAYINICKVDWFILHIDGILCFVTCLRRGLVSVIHSIKQ